MWSTVDSQLNSQPDTWYDFTNRMNMFGFGLGTIVIGCLSIYGAFLNWFTPEPSYISLSSMSKFA